MLKSKIIEVIIKGISSYPWFLHKRLFIIRPCSVSIARSANVCVKRYCFFNSEFNNMRVWKNRKSGRFFLGKHSTLKIDSARFYSGTTLSVSDNATLSIGKSYFNYDCRISCFNEITIGDGCAISQNVTIRDSDNHQVIREGYIKSAPIVIDDHVWVGINSTILKGVHIGEGSIIAAGSVVTKNIPPHSLVAGVPAHVIKTNVHWV